MPDHPSTPFRPTMRVTEGDNVSIMGRYNVCCFFCNYLDYYSTSASSLLIPKTWKNQILGNYWPSSNLFPGPISTFVSKPILSTPSDWIKGQNKANKSELLDIWQTIKIDRKRHMHMLKEALEKEIHA